MTTPPSLDLTQPQAVVEEIFDDDRWIKDEFSMHCEAEIFGFGTTLAESFAKFSQVDALAAGDEQAAFVAGFVHGIFDDLITSTKLLISGKLMASGNLMRQAIEGVAVALLCSSRKLLIIPSGSKKKPPDQVHYWKLVRDEDKKVSSNRSLDHLRLNVDTLKLSAVGVSDLKRARDNYHKYSHPGMMGIASRIALGEPGPIYIGGSFDAAKIPHYKNEINERTALCRTLPTLIDTLIANLSASAKP